MSVCPIIRHKSIRLSRMGARHSCGDLSALKRFCQYKFEPPTDAEGEDAIGTAQSPERTGPFES
jgi:hypothetical protein